MSSKREKPKLRDEAHFELLSGLRGLLARVTHMNGQVHSPVQSCVTCLNFDLPSEICKLCNLRPPADVIAYGCNKYDDENGIPF